MPIPALDALTLPQKIGQMMGVGWDGENRDSVNDHARFLLKDLHAGTLILFRRNVRTGNGMVDARRLRDSISELQSLSALPLLVGMDQEGGNVQRLKGIPFTDIPSARTLGDSGDTNRARHIARRVAQELRAVGINWNFAPVADVDSNPNNPVIGNRAFSTDAQTVARFVTAQIEGFAEGGILTCAKHFPGHGDTLQDSHYDLPMLPHGIMELEQRELIPFRAAIAAHVDAIMTAHILFPALDDSHLPATMNPAILTDLLRRTAGYAGLIVTDCLEMKAIADNYGTANGALKAVEAGADIVMVCHTMACQQEVFDTLLFAAESGRLSLERVNASVVRILAAKSRLATLPITPAAWDTSDTPFDRVIMTDSASKSLIGESAPVVK